MRNAKEELLNAFDYFSTSKIKCAQINHGSFYSDTQKSIILPVGYSIKQLENFLNELDFEYDNGWGGQELYGTIWLEDGTWFSRGEYDGSEWWVYNKLPEIPEECFKD